MAGHRRALLAGGLLAILTLGLYRPAGLSPSTLHLSPSTLPLSPSTLPLSPSTIHSPRLHPLFEIPDWNKVQADQLGDIYCAVNERLWVRRGRLGARAGLGGY
jgi:hypothetical protein